MNELIKKLNDLNAAKAAALDKAEKIAAMDEIPDAEQVALDEALATIDKLTKQIATTQKLIEAKKASKSVAAEFDDDTTISGGNLAIESDPKRGFKSMGEFAAAVIHAGKGGARIDERLIINAAATGMSEGIGVDGGFAVAPAFAKTIWEGVTQNENSLMALTDNYDIMGSDSITFPKVNVTTHASGSRFGGVTAYWTDEAGALTGSKPKLSTMTLKPSKLTALVYITSELLRNATAMDTFINRAMTAALLAKTNNAILHGDGVGKPKGLLNSGAVITVAAESSQTAATVVSENIKKMWARLLPGSQSSAVWLINQTVSPFLETLNIPTRYVGATKTMASVIESIYNAGTDTIKGRPIIVTEHCKAVGTVGDIILADMNYYATAMRGAARGDVSMHLRFNYDEMAFRLIVEFDGQPWIETALTPENGDTLSPFISLAAR